MDEIKIKEEDIEFLESWYTPIEFLEVIFHDFNNLTTYKPGKYGEVRLYQYPMISDETLIDFEMTAEYHDLNKKEEFQLRKNVGDLYCFGGRKFGKSLAVHIMDLLKQLLADDHTDKIVLGSADSSHLQQILDPIKNALCNHKILKMFLRRSTGLPKYNIEMKNNASLKSINFNLHSSTPGKDYLGVHCDRLLIEEASMETEEVYDKRKDALSEFGAIFRVSGMTDFTPHSPAGKMFYKLDNQKFVLNLPQFVSPFWDEKEKENRIEEYGGEESINYKVYCKGEVVEDGVTALDMQRIRSSCYLMDSTGRFKKQIKRFEISKENFRFWKNLIVVERPENATRIWISSDVGKKVTELVIHSETDEGTYEYIYNITLCNLTQQEVETIFKSIIRKLNANVIAIDCGDGEGRGIFSGFELEFPKENLVYYDGSKKIKVGFEYEEYQDEDGEIVKEIKLDKDGQPEYKYELMSDFSVQRLKVLLYDGKCKIPQDYKFDKQFSSVIETVLAGKTKYKCMCSQGDHLFDGWKVWAIAQWLKAEFDDSIDIDNNSDWGVGACN